MKIVPKAAYLRYTLAIASALAATVLSSHAQSATGSLTYQNAGGGEFDYTVTLDNTGSAPLEDLWYGWTSSGNNLPNVPAEYPSNAGNSLGWANDLDNNSIMYEGGAGDALAPGHTATFTFESTATPTQLTTGGVGDSVVYEHGIDFSQGTSGDSSGSFSVVPEPSTWTLAFGGLLAAIGSSRFIRRNAKA